jgi:SAM-dependent methyltransferase
VSIEEQNAPYFEANRARWDESVAIHAASKGYDLEGFLRGEKTLYPVEMAEVGDVAGKSLLHLQCHFGMDTLNWARLGARVTGLDFSEAAVERARLLAGEIGVTDATFVQSNVYDAPEAIHEQFDIIYTGIGALCWLPDIRAWAQVVATLLKPGGFVYVYEGHPVLWALDNERDDDQLILAEPYFETAEPTEFIGEYTYTDGPPLVNTHDYEWNHGLGEIVTALIESGLRLDFLHEHREVAWKALPHLTSGEAASPDSRYSRREAWQLPTAQRDLCPLMYSLKATRPG